MPVAEHETFGNGQLAAMRRPPLAKRVRRSTRLSQEAFAERFGIPLRTLQEWEQGRREPDAAVESYLRVIEKEPDIVAHALAVE
ncbi:XRE family transcriptional regulator [Azospirillum thiophilum]|uniref:XRE family transcriptional regulator n=1 Tax=Azospirillum thiophilum TaxID=528244 RepID=A0AAC8ZTQ7_9PROT|nr:helix-turn-helix domain-containing protein [Azospirillum thiophilum]ALG71110.1 XRE family transcriptional regulator [Azospirillum thiophilum]KJR65231.1 XRE family transcriptional regulator [Azospirillum thiophilum]